MVTTMLRITVYNHNRLALVTHGINKKWSPLIVVFATFVVLGFMHELIFYYLGSMSCLEDGGFYPQVAVAMADFGAFGNWICVHYLILAVFPTIPLV
ncbi:hypothetical protein CFP56_010904 [Quercus suber]|uniref:Uncharacterized protein n=1 Tax=Quercus suber TaxID=58331 RepID=A0AAW0L0E4_QUESU